jgi:flavin reductase (DIM6/NTAB) family NADH-FMN oxidoreductase RutF
MAPDCGNEGGERFDSLHFRSALSRFATGVTVVTTHAGNGAFAGLTVNSFNSVSLAPPLVLWSLGTGSSCLPLFSGCAHYLINVLSSEQSELALRFASRIANRFDGVAFTLSPVGLPVLEGASAWFECVNRSQYLEGDHVIFVGEVRRIGLSARPGLIFQNGQFLQAFSASC